MTAVKVDYRTRVFGGRCVSWCHCNGGLVSWVCCGKTSRCAGVDWLMNELRCARMRDLEKSRVSYNFVDVLERPRLRSPFLCCVAGWRLFGAQCVRVFGGRSFWRSLRSSIWRSVRSTGGESRV